MQLELLAHDPTHLRRLVARNGPNLFYRSVEQRLLCCNVRKVQPLTRHLHGLDAWITGLRRDQWASRAEIRKVEIDHDHGAIVKLNPLAEWTEEEVWDYVREHGVPYPPTLRTRLLVDRLRTLHAGDAPGRAGPRRPLVVGDERAEGVRHPLRDRDGRHGARAARDPRRRPPSGNMTDLRPDEQEVARGEAQAVLAVAADQGLSRRAFLTGRRRGRGLARDQEGRTLERLLELGLQAGRLRAVYGPGGEQAALRLYRRLPRGAEVGASARSVTEALGGAPRAALESISVDAVGPGAYTLSVAVDGARLSIRLDRQGARVGSLGT